MISVEHAKLMADYNRWMNAKLYDAAAKLSDEQRREDRGAFFKSIHGTLVHLLLADLAWYWRFIGKTLDGLREMVDQHHDFESLRAKRERVDAELQAWVRTLTPTWLAADFTYFSMAYNEAYTRPAWVLVTHLFNHETHHRGQIMTLLTQLGVDIGDTDLPLLPDLVTAYDEPLPPAKR